MSSNNKVANDFSDIARRMRELGCTSDEPPKDGPGAVAAVVPLIADDIDRAYTARAREYYAKYLESFQQPAQRYYPDTGVVTPTP